MSIDSAKNFVERMKSDEEFSKKLFACENSDSRIKLIETEGYNFSIAEIMKEVNSAKYKKTVKKLESDDWKWLEIVAVWSIDRRKGWRGDILDRSVRNILNEKYIEIQCPHCSQHYYTTEDYSGRTLECEACSKVFTVGLSSVSGSENTVEHSNAEGPAGPIKISENNIWKNWK
jgi:predicted ribosomally synthesized peptide with nif11-like leader